MMPLEQRFRSSGLRFTKNILHRYNITLTTNSYHLDTVSTEKDTVAKRQKKIHSNKEQIGTSVSGYVQKSRNKCSIDNCLLHMYYPGNGTTGFGCACTMYYPDDRTTGVGGCVCIA